LGDYKINSPNNPKTVIGTSPNTSYWEGIIGRLMEMLLVALVYVVSPIQPGVLKVLTIHA